MSLRHTTLSTAFTIMLSVTTNPASAQPPDETEGGAETEQKLWAAVIAVDDYPSGRGPDLNSCVADANAVQATLASQGFEVVASHADSDATVANFRAAMSDLSTRAKAGDVVCVFYSGHGGTDWKIAQNRFVGEEYLACYDANYSDDDFVADSHMFKDGVKFFAFIDACYSGGLSKDVSILTAKNLLDTTYNTPNKILVTEEFAELVNSRETFDPLTLTSGFFIDRFGGETKRYLPLHGNLIELKTTFNNTSDEAGQPSLNGSLISACQENETAAAGTVLTAGKSAFTYAWLKAFSEQPNASIRQLGVATGAILKTLGYKQTPRIDGEDEFLESKFATLDAPPGDKGTEKDLPAILAELSTGVNALVQANEKVAAPIDFDFGSLYGDPRIVYPEIDQLLQKSQGAPNANAKLFGIDDAILIPAIATVVTAAINKEQGTSKSPEDFVPLAIEIIRALQKSDAQQKLGISLGGGISTPLGGVQIGGSVTDKNAAAYVPLAIEIIRALQKSQGAPNANAKLFGIDDAILIPAIATVVTAAINKEQGTSKSPEDFVPLAIEIIRALQKSDAQQKLGISLGGGISTPLGGVQFGGSVTDKNVAAYVPLAIEIIRALQKSQGAPNANAKLFGIDDAILIPAIATVVTAAINKEQGTSKSPEDFVPLAIEIIRALQKSDAQQKLGISLGGGISTPLGGVQIGGSVTDKNAAAYVPLAIEIIRALQKSQGAPNANAKLFGIDDAILIPAIATVVTAAINKEQGTSKSPEDFVPLAIEIIRALQKSDAQQKVRSVPRLGIAPDYWDELLGRMPYRPLPTISY